MPTLSLLEHEPLHERVYREIKKAIISGKFTPGQTITIRSIAEELGTSATPVREALRQLIAEHALEMRSNRSVNVPVMTSDRFSELVGLRRMLEGLAAERAADHVEAAEIDRLDALNREMIAAIKVGNSERYLTLNEDFHFAIYRAACSPVLLSLIELLWVQTGPFFNKLFEDLDDPKGLHVHHTEVIAALRRGDGKGAMRALMNDIGSAAEHLKSFTVETDGPIGPVS